MRIPREELQLTSPCGIYVVAAGDGHPCKIGITDAPGARLAELQVANWQRLSMTFFAFAFQPGARSGRKAGLTIGSFREHAASLERRVHKRLTFLDLHIRGEWFDVDFEEAEAVIRKVAETESYRLMDCASAVCLPDAVAAGDRELWVLSLMRQAAAAGQIVVSEAMSELACGGD